MSLINKLSQFATSRAKPSISHRKDPRSNFITTAREQARYIERGDIKGYWFQRWDDKVVVTLRNGAAVLFLEPKIGQHVCPSPTAAVGLLNAACEMAEAGELDLLFAATAKKSS